MLKVAVPWPATQVSILLAPSASVGAGAPAVLAPAPAPAPAAPGLVAAQAQAHQAAPGLVLAAVPLPHVPSLVLAALAPGQVLDPVPGLALALTPTVVLGMVTPTQMFAKALEAMVVVLMLMQTLAMVQVHGLALLPTAAGVPETTTTTTPATVARSSTTTVCMRTRTSTLARSARSGVAMAMAATAATKALMYMRKHQALL